MLIRIYNENPNPKQIRQIVDLLEVGGIIIYPTDTVYAMGCDILATKSIEKIARLKGLNPKNPELSLIFHDMSQLSEYTIIRDNTIFKLLKRNLPGPFTFIVQANNQIPKLFKNKKKTVGIRIPDLFTKNIRSLQMLLSMVVLGEMKHLQLLIVPVTKLKFCVRD